MPRTGYEAPTAEELRRLREIVLAEHRWLRDPGDRRSEKAKENEFASAFWAAGHFYRTPEPNRVYYFSHFVDLANERLAMIDREAVDGNAFLVACVAHADVVYQRPDRMLGAVLEVGLNEHAGRPCSNAWRKVLTGEALLLKPVAPRQLAREAVTPPRVWRIDPAGALHPDESFGGEWR